MKKLYKNLISFVMLSVVLLSLYSCSETSESGQSIISNSVISSSDNLDTGKYAEQGELKIRIFKMGKSDAYLFRTSNKTILIDCGDADDAQEIIDYFSEKGLTKIDYLIFTHKDKKSIGGAASVISALEIGSIYEPNYEKNSSEYAEYLNAVTTKGINANIVNSEVSFETDDVKFKITPCSKTSYDDDDNYTCMISVIHGENSFLFVGDAKSERIEEIISMNDIKHDFLMMPDNGQYDEKTSDLLESVSPTYAAITCSDKNPASGEVLSLLSDKGINYYLTVNGSIKITSDSKSIIIEQ